MKTKKQYRNENIVAAILIITSIAIIIYCRIDGMSLTEGEIFVAYWPGWALSIVCLSAGLSILTTPDINHGPPRPRPKAPERLGKGIVYNPSERTIECNGVVYDFYCGKDLDEQSMVLVQLVFGKITLQDAYIDTLINSRTNEPDLEYAEKWNDGQL